MVVVLAHIVQVVVLAARADALQRVWAMCTRVGNKVANYPLGTG